MLAAERRERILARLSAEGVVRVSDLAIALDVSEMTIHRDLNALAADGKLEKVHGGARLLPTETVAGQATPGACSMCGRFGPPNTAFLINCMDGAQQTACCPHCGLMLINQASTAAASALTQDFLYGRMINAASAWYVFDPTVAVCCTPSVLSFSRREEAEGFRRGFGGTVLNYEDALRTLGNAMRLHKHT